MDAQQLLPYNADSLVECGHSSSILRGNAGAFNAQQTLLVTADSLVESGHSSSILGGSAGAFKAQQTLLATSSALVRTGFTRSEVDALRMGNNGSAKGQQVISVYSTFDFLWVLQSSNC